MSSSEFLPLVKANSATNLRSRDECTSAEVLHNQTKSPESGKAVESPILNRKVNDSAEGPLPKVQSPVIKKKRISLSLTQLSLQQKLKLQHILKTNHPSYVIDDAFWSTHWLETRSLLLLNDKKPSVQFDSDDSLQSAEVTENKPSNESDLYLTSYECEDLVCTRSESTPVVLSLEDRLLLIEQMHGLNHSTTK